MRFVGMHMLLFLLMTPALTVLSTARPPGRPPAQLGCAGQCYAQGPGPREAALAARPVTETRDAEELTRVERDPLDANTGKIERATRDPCGRAEALTRGPPLGDSLLHELARDCPAGGSAVHCRRIENGGLLHRPLSPWVDRCAHALPASSRTPCWWRGAPPGERSGLARLAEPGGTRCVVMLDTDVAALVVMLDTDVAALRHYRGEDPARNHGLTIRGCALRAWRCCSCLRPWPSSTWRGSPVYYDALWWPSV